MTRSHWFGTAVLVAAMAAAGCGGHPVYPVASASRPATYRATAYCQSGLTASGVPVREGIVAADPAVLPLGTVIRVDGLSRPYNKVYRVMDTGSGIRGREIDVFMPDCREAIRFGRRTALVSIVKRSSDSTR